MNTRTIKKIALVLLSLISICYKTYSQENYKPKFEIEGTFGIPTRKENISVVGGDLKITKQITPKLDVGLGLGFYHFFENPSIPLNTDKSENYSYGTGRWEHLLARAYFRYHLPKGFYIQAKAGSSLGIQECFKPTWSAGIGKMWNNRVGVSLNYEDFGYSLNKFVGFSLFYNPRFKKNRSNTMHLDNNDTWSLSVLGSIGAGFNKDLGRYSTIGIQISNALTQKLDIIWETGLSKYWYNTKLAFPYGYNETQTMTTIPVKAGLRYQFHKPFFVAATYGISVDLQEGSHWVFTPEIGAKLSNKVNLSIQYEDYNYDHYRSMSLSLIGLKASFKL